MTRVQSGKKCAIALAVCTVAIGGVAKASVTGFGSTGVGYTLNGGATVTGDVLTVTDGANSEARSAFYNTPQSYTTGGWTANFTYTGTNGSTGTLADGVAFVLQNDPRGAAALGGTGGSFGYGGSTPIINSGSFQLNIFPGGGGVGVNYARGAGINNSGTVGYLPTGSVNLASGDPINVSLAYNGGGVVTETLTDSITPANTFSNSYTVHAPDFGGNNFLVGFTGATGGFNSVQTVKNFSFTTSGAVAPAPQGILKAGDLIVGSSTNTSGDGGVANAIDQNPNTKYLNFDKTNTGFTVTPTVGASIVTTLTLTSANDTPARDPASYILSGSNDGGLTFTQISAGTVPVLNERFGEEDIAITNSTAYTTYQVVFPTLVNAGATNSMQIADVQFYGSLAAVPEPTTLGVLALGGAALLGRRRRHA